jgi:hypothetical protein
MAGLAGKLTVRFPSPGRRYDPLNEAAFRSDLERLLDRLAGALGLGSRVPVFVDADTTPSVRQGTVFTVTNSGATSITTFNDAEVGQRILLMFTDANTTIVDGANLHLAGGANFVSSADDTMELVWNGTSWFEISRSVN